MASKNLNLLSFPSGNSPHHLLAFSAKPEPSGTQHDTPAPTQPTLATSVQHENHLARRIAYRTFADVQISLNQDDRSITNDAFRNMKFTIYEALRNLGDNTLGLIDNAHENGEMAVEAAQRETSMDIADVLDRFVLGNLDLDRMRKSAQSLSDYLKSTEAPTAQGMKIAALTA